MEYNNANYTSEHYKFQSDLNSIFPSKPEMDYINCQTEQYYIFKNSDEENHLSLPELRNEIINMINLGYAKSDKQTLLRAANLLNILILKHD